MRDEGLAQGDEPFANLLTKAWSWRVLIFAKMPMVVKSHYFPEEVDIRYNDKGQPIEATLKSRWSACQNWQNRKNVEVKNNGVDPQATIDQYGAIRLTLHHVYRACRPNLEWIDDG